MVVFLCLGYTSMNLVFHMRYDAEQRYHLLLAIQLIMSIIFAIIKYSFF